MTKTTDTVCKINMTVINDDNFLSPYSATETPVISEEVADFLDNGAANFLPKQQIELSVHSDCIDDNEKVQYKKAIRNYFTQKLNSLKTEFKRNTIMSVIFTLIGILGLAVMFILDYCGIKAIWVECVDIFAWVFLWEAVDQFFIERRKLAFQRKKLQAFIEMEINYYGIKNAVELN